MTHKNIPQVLDTLDADSGPVVGLVICLASGVITIIAILWMAL